MGDCLIHAIFGKEKKGFVVCEEIINQRNILAGQIPNYVELLKPELKRVIKEAIKFITHDTESHPGFEALQKYCKDKEKELNESMKVRYGVLMDKLLEFKKYNPRFWDRLRIKYNGNFDNENFGPYIDTADRFTEFLQEKKDAWQKVNIFQTVYSQVIADEKVENFLCDNSNMIRTQFNQITVEINEKELDFDLDNNLLETYKREILAKQGKYLSVADCGVIAVLINKKIEYFTQGDKGIQLIEKFNPNASETVRVCHNGSNHYERVKREVVTVVPSAPPASPASPT